MPLGYNVGQVSDLASLDAELPPCIINPDMITRINQRAATNVLELVGGTPLLELPVISAEVPGVEILGKAEWYTPGGSVKDRPALWMIRDGEKTGSLTPEKTILDATSGNTGIAYAWIGAALGYRVKLCMPKNASDERKKILRAYGVDFVLTDPDDGSDGAIREARRLYAEDPEHYFYPDQYSNPANRARTTNRRRLRSGSRRTARSRTSSPGSARAALLSVRRPVSRSTTRG